MRCRPRFVPPRSSRQFIYTQFDECQLVNQGLRCTRTLSREIKPLRCCTLRSRVFAHQSVVAFLNTEHSGFNLFSVSKSRLHVRFSIMIYEVLKEKIASFVSPTGDNLLLAPFSPTYNSADFEELTALRTLSLPCAPLRRCWLWARRRALQPPCLSNRISFSTPVDRAPRPSKSRRRPTLPSKDPPP